MEGRGGSFLPSSSSPQQTLPSLPGGGISASKSPSSSSPIPASAAREREAPALTWSKIHQRLVVASSSTSPKPLGPGLYQSLGFCSPKKSGDFLSFGLFSLYLTGMDSLAPPANVVYEDPEAGDFHRRLTNRMCHNRKEEGPLPLPPPTSPISAAPKGRGRKPSFSPPPSSIPSPLTGSSRRRRRLSRKKERGGGGRDRRRRGSPSSLIS